MEVCGGIRDECEELRNGTEHHVNNGVLRGGEGREGGREGVEYC